MPKYFGLLKEVGHFAKWWVFTEITFFGSNFFRSVIRARTGSFANVCAGTSPLYIKVGQILGLSKNGSWDLVDAHRVFRWFKFTLKPPYSGASEHSLLAIWDTSHWNFFVKFGLRTAWDISYDILLSLLKFVNFWRLQGRLSILAKIGCLQKIKVFSMKEQRGFDATWGF